MVIERTYSSAHHHVALAAKQVVLGYELSHISRSLRSIDDVKLRAELDIGGKYLIHGDIANAAGSYKWQYPDRRRVGSKEAWE